MKPSIALAAAAALHVGAALLARSCAADAATSAAVTPTSGVHAIELPRLDAPLPAGPGQETIAVCAVCHSNRYITMQPPLSKTAWKAVVDKMRKTFGAPINDEQAGQVVNYLATIRGNGKP